MKSTMLRAALAALATTTAFAAHAQDAAPFTMGIWGDMPYAKANDAPAIPALIADMNASDIAFSMYDGDIKDGSSECVDATYTDGIAMFDSLAKPVIYVPGDNEWTDCHRLNNGSWDNLERLDHIRKTMFASDETFGMEKMVVEHQGKPAEAYAENTRYSKAGAMFVGLNIPGSNNNKVNGEKDCTKKSARTAEQCAADNAEYEARDAANIEWMKASFAKAKADGDKGIMLVIQADPGFDIPETEDADESRMEGKEGYVAFLDALIAETEAYDGQVVLVHGDTHYFKMDKPLPNASHMLANFTRVQTFGSPNVHWIKVDVDAASRDVFTFHPMIVAANAKKSLN
jgi:hypothetical protein